MGLQKLINNQQKRDEKQTKKSGEIENARESVKYFLGLDSKCLDIGKLNYEKSKTMSALQKSSIGSNSSLYTQVEAHYNLLLAQLSSQPEPPSSQQTEFKERIYTGTLTIYNVNLTVKVKTLPQSIIISRALSYYRTNIKESEELQYINWTFGVGGRISLVDILLNPEQKENYEIIKVINPGNLGQYWGSAEAQYRQIPPEAKIVNPQIELSEFSEKYRLLTLEGHKLTRDIIKKTPRSEITYKDLIEILSDNNAGIMLQKVAALWPRIKTKKGNRFLIQY